MDGDEDEPLWGRGYGYKPSAGTGGVWDELCSDGSLVTGHYLQ